ncbi:hypothetical protein [Helicobacter felis]|uniref:hypothetical protein n=1 Tax=Helicobacter felis TaxID=214 RepID=UPI0013CE1944|nr:hypothetical protein [Helicobacter felis]
MLILYVKMPLLYQVFKPLRRLSSKLSSELVSAPFRVDSLQTITLKKGHFASSLPNLPCGASK